MARHIHVVRPRKEGYIVHNVFGFGSFLSEQTFISMPQLVILFICYDLHSNKPGVFKLLGIERLQIFGAGSYTIIIDLYCV